MYGPRALVPLEERFWAKVDRRGDAECWEWTACRAPSGYGRIGIGQQRDTDYAHRVSWRLHFGEIPDGLYVCHRCDNPPCVNPAHLFLGTHAENMRDAQVKGRVRNNPRRGESNGWAKLTDATVRDARRLWASGTSMRSLAKRYGVTFRTMDDAVKGLSWRHVA